MAKATKVTVADGKTYQPGEEIWDTGSFECVGVDGSRRHYQGLAADVDKLPKYEDLGAGSSATCIDTGDFYYYHAKTRTWYKQE